MLLSPTRAFRRTTLATLAALFVAGCTVAALKLASTAPTAGASPEAASVWWRAPAYVVSDLLPSWWLPVLAIAVVAGAIAARLAASRSRDLAEFDHGD